MRISINQQGTILETGSTLQELAIVIGIAEVRGVAVAVNNKVVPKAQWEVFSLQDNDKITVIKATQGG